MRFTDQFETLLSNGLSFNVEVTGNRIVTEDDAFIQIDEVVVTDDLGNPVDEDSEYYQELKDIALDREYTPEIHATDFEYYTHAVDNYLQTDDVIDLVG